MVRPFSLLVKPASADCNLRCEYCFYLGHSSFYPATRTHRMSDQVLARMIQTYMATPQPTYQFGWQGGEPTLMGLDFFRRVVELQEKHGKAGVTVANGLQTNGTLITDDLARHLARYNFLLGVSLDGPREMHDKYRKGLRGGGSYDDVMPGIEQLSRHGVEFNILTLVSQANVQRPDDVYQFLCDQGFLYHQYIACVEADDELESLPFAISGPEWGDFMCAIFDRWRGRDERRVSIRLFDAILALLVNGDRNLCHLGRNCCQYFVVEHNGDVFPCDFFVEERLRLGNVMADSWSVLQQSAVYADFGRRKSQWHSDCQTCTFAWICGGDCLKHRLCAEAGEPRRLSELCEGWRRFYAHSLPRFREMAAGIRAERRQGPVAPAQPGESGRPGRNDPCPCGSGRKYKKCHGAR